MCVFCTFAWCATQCLCNVTRNSFDGISAAGQSALRGTQVEVQNIYSTLYKKYYAHSRKF